MMPSSSFGSRLAENSRDRCWNTDSPALGQRGREHPTPSRSLADRHQEAGSADRRWRSAAFSSFIVDKPQTKKRRSDALPSLHQRSGGIFVAPERKWDRSGQFEKLWSPTSSDEPNSEGLYIKLPVQPQSVRPPTPRAVGIPSSALDEAR